MKTLDVILIILLVIAVVFGGVLGYSLMEKDKQIAEKDKQIIEKDEQIAEKDKQISFWKENLQVQVETLKKQAYPRAFKDIIELVDWVTENHIPYPYYNYNPEDAMRFMEIAREDGLWMGVIPVATIESFGDRIFVIPGIAQSYPNYYLFNVALVEDENYGNSLAVYLIDSQIGDIARLKINISKGLPKPKE